MSGDVLPEQDLLWRGIEAINACVERLPSMTTRNRVLRRLRDHLDARIEQTESDEPARKNIEDLL